MSKYPADHRAQAAAWFAALRDRICGAFEQIEDALTGSDRPAGRFERKTWDRPDPEAGEGGGGEMSIMRGPRLREGRGQYLDRARRVQPGVPQVDPRRRRRWKILGQRLSLVAHMHSPLVPACT